jgi:hypothetical protein
MVADVSMTFPTRGLTSPAGARGTSGRDADAAQRERHHPARIRGRRIGAHLADLEAGQIRQVWCSAPQVYSASSACAVDAPCALAAVEDRAADARAGQAQVSAELDRRVVAYGKTRKRPWPSMTRPRTCSRVSGSWSRRAI